jgi:hypothetical protein
VEEFADQFIARIPHPAAAYHWVQIEEEPNDISATEGRS